MAQILAALRDDHRNYSRLLRLLRSDIDKLEHSASPDFIRMYDIMNYMTNYPDVSHHPAEEIMFAALGKKTADSAELINILNNEHKKLVKLGMALKEKLNHITSGSIVSKDAVIETANDYYQLLTGHINTEETQMFPIIENLFSAEDWSQVSEQIEGVEDPLFGDVVQEQFADLYKRIILSQNEVT